MNQYPAGFLILVPMPFIAFSPGGSDIGGE
jgi:hypothetical protein